MVGAVLLGAATSLPGLVLTVTAASSGDTDLAFSNAIGGVAAQTFFIAIADIAYRKGTLSSQVPTREAAFQAALLVVLLSVLLIALSSPDAAIGRIHLTTPLVVVLYFAGLAAGRRLGTDLRLARSEVAGDSTEAEGGHGGAQGKLGRIHSVDPRLAAASSARLWLRFAVMATILGLAGVGLASAGSELTDRYGLSQVSIGFVLTAVLSSTPELVTAIAAARRGAIGLAAGDIIGGNVFDTLFVAAADFASSDPLPQVVAGSAVGLVGLAMLLNGLLLAGLMRQGDGTRAIDAESLLIVAVWAAGVVVLIT